MSFAALSNAVTTATKGAKRAPSRIWGMLAVAGLLLIVLAMFLRGLEHPTEWVIPADKMTHLDGRAWTVDVRKRAGWPWQAHGDDLFDRNRSDALLYEDGRPLGPPHTQIDQVEAIGGGSYAHWGRKLLFSTSDGSDPRGNGREYRVTFTAGLGRNLLLRLANTGSVLLAIALVGLAWQHRRALAARTFKLLRRLPHRIPDALLAAVIPATLAGLAWTQLPALWNGSDSVIWLLWQVTWIPHHAPAYPLMMHLLERLTGDDPAGMLHGAMLIQHSLQVVGVAWVATAFRGPWRILLVSAAASLGTSYGLFSHGLFTEGLANPLLLLIVGALLRLWRDGPTLSVMIALAFTLLIGSLSRHLMIVFAGMPVLFLLLLALRRHRLRAGWRPVGMAVVLALGVLGANTAINAWLSLLLDAQTVSMLGRPGIYRIQDAYNLVPLNERERWLAELQSRAADPAVRAALPLMTSVANPWTGPAGALTREPALYGIHPDALMTAGFKAFLLWPNEAVWTQWSQEFLHAAFGLEHWGSNVGQVRRLLLESAASVDTVLPRDPRAVAAARATGTGAGDPASAIQYRALAEQSWARLADRFLPLGPPARMLWLGISLMLLIAALWRGRDLGLTSLMLTLWGGALAYLLALTLITVTLPRYLTPVDLLLWLSNALAVLVLTSAYPRTAAGDR